MIPLRQAILEAKEKKVALGHFNISNMEAVWAIVNSAKELNVPVVIGVSEGERDYFGVRQIRDIVWSIREEIGHPIYINADHTYSFERVKEVIDLEYDSVIVDGAKLPLEENIAMTKQCVDYARSVGRDVLVEAELGYIGTSSKMLDELPEGATLSAGAMPTGQECKDFVDQTGVDLLSPAVGNIHGMLKNAPNPELNIDRIREIADTCGVPLVLHGGSGIREQNFIDAIANGISMIHINTEIRYAFRSALDEFLKNNPDEVAPYKIMAPTIKAMQEVITGRLKLFSNK